MGRRIPPSLCARCKGYKRLCGLPTCPILERFRAQAAAAPRIRGGLVEGDTPPSVVVGEKGYPLVPVLYNVPPGVYGDRARWHDDPRGWAAAAVPLREIVGLRSSLVAPMLRVRVEKPWVLYEREVSLAAVSEKPVDTEARLEKMPTPRLSFDGLLAPQGPAAPARELRVAGNPRVPRPLDRMIWDDLRAEEAVRELYRAGLDVYTIIYAFSLGLLGRSRSRRLVPTRWAITAVDQVIGNALLREARSSGEVVDSYEVYHHCYLGNCFTIVLAPGAYQAEMVEVWHPLTPWTGTAKKPIVYTITETPTKKMSMMDGGYIAARLAVAEHLARRRRQAAVLILREVTREYYAPVGNWHIRETVRKALSKKPVAIVSSLEEALEEAARFARSPEARASLLSSRLAARVRSQVSLDKWLRPGSRS